MDGRTTDSEIQMATFKSAYIVVSRETKLTKAERCSNLIPHWRTTRKPNIFEVLVHGRYELFFRSRLEGISTQVPIL
ncbi:hypothetical protein Mapa_000108 [Marchantia paleacea]|nr:hypothetical protein Mapa_000108 [Marchantia paleacea]